MQSQLEAQSTVRPVPRTQQNAKPTPRIHQRGIMIEWRGRILHFDVFEDAELGFAKKTSECLPSSRKGDEDADSDEEVIVAGIKRVATSLVEATNRENLCKRLKVEDILHL